MDSEHSSDIPLFGTLTLEHPGIGNDLSAFLNEDMNASVVDVIVLRLQNMLLAHKYVKPRPDNLKEFCQNKGWNLVSFEIHNANLEEVFLKLAGEEEGVDK